MRRGGFAYIDVDGPFDLVVAMNGPFSYLPTPDDREDAALCAFGALRPGGLVVIDLANFPWILKNYREHPPTNGVPAATRRSGASPRTSSTSTTAPGSTPTASSSARDRTSGPW